MHNPNYLYDKYKNKLNNENIIENRNLINKSSIITNNNKSYNNYYWKIYYIEIYDYRTQNDSVCICEDIQNDLPYKYILDNDNTKIITDDKVFYIKYDINFDENNNSSNNNTIDTYNYISTEILADKFIKNGKTYKKISINSLSSNLKFYNAISNSNNNDNDNSNNNTNDKVIYYLPYKFILCKLNEDNEYIPVELPKSLTSSNKVKSYITLLLKDENNYYTNYKTFNITYSFDNNLSFVIDDIEYINKLLYEYYNGSTTIARKVNIKYICDNNDNDKSKELYLFKEYKTLSEFLNDFNKYNYTMILTTDLIYQ